MTGSIKRDPDGGKRHPLNMRTTKRIRDLLEDAARESGRSLVGEVEYRLERSFRDDEVLQAIAALRYRRSDCTVADLIAIEPIPASLIAALTGSGNG